MADSFNLLRSFFREALLQVDVVAAVRREIQSDGLILSIAGRQFDLRELNRVAIIAVGKAAAPMYEAAIQTLDVLTKKGIMLDAIVVAPAHPRTAAGNLVFYEGSHPTPNETSRAAADGILRHLQMVDGRTLVLYLISGGASSMIERPLDEEISVAETAQFHSSLVASGLPIAKINILRKHFSAVKGGRLAAAAQYAAAQCTLIVSDVPEQTSESVGSGPSVPDPSTVAESLHILESLRTSSTISSRVLSFFEGPLLRETPKSGDRIFERSSAREILSSRNLAEAAARVAASAGFYVEIDNTCDDWDFRKAGSYLLDRFAGLAADHAHVCLISSGEISVCIDGPSGYGGRNQHLALWCALELAESRYPVTMLSAGSDGVDGNSAAAGAVVDCTTVERAHMHGIDARASLRAFDSFRLFHALGDTIMTGPTENNLRDLRILLR